jgi:hypothetical protein
VAKLLVFSNKLRSGTFALLDANLTNCRRLVAEIKERREKIDRAFRELSGNQLRSCLAIADLKSHMRSKI